MPRRAALRAVAWIALYSVLPLLLLPALLCPRLGARVLDRVSGR